MIAAVSGILRENVQAATGDIRWPMELVWLALALRPLTHQRTRCVLNGIKLYAWPVPSGPISTMQASVRLSVINVTLGINTMEPV